MLKLGPRLRAFVRPTPDGKPEVLDFVRQAMLDMIGERIRASEPPAPLEAGKTS
jgi:hypothetical protein